MPQYMLILYDDREEENYTPEQMQQIVQEYSAWARDVAAKGQLVTGEKLTSDEGRTVRLENGQPKVTDGPFIETKEVIGGFFIIQADSYDEASEITKTCPHMRYGLRAEIRQVEEVAS